MLLTSKIQQVFKKLLVQQVQDQYVRENAQRVNNYLAAQVFLNSNWGFFEIVEQTNGTFVLPHGLGFQPLDVIQTSIKGTGSITWNYAQFTPEDFSFTTAGTSTSDPLHVRLFLGRAT